MLVIRAGLFDSFFRILPTVHFKVRGRELLWHLADRVSGGNAILILDEINWLGRGDSQFRSKLWRLWETNLSELNNFILASQPLRHAGTAAAVPGHENSQHAR